ncbi:MAG: response regulator [Nitrosopumilus sp.]|nr:response regulator [Nitrosopumilus sp.]
MSKTAIVIDDDIEFVDIFSQLLEEANTDVVGKGHNGKEAIDLFKEKNPNFVFIDLNMPDGTGFHAIRNIKKIDESAKIIAVTGKNDFSTQGKLQKLDIHGFIHKPVDMNKIIELIEN